MHCNDDWYVISAPALFHFLKDKNGQRCENPLVCANLGVGQIAEFKIDFANIKSAVAKAASDGEKNQALKIAALNVLVEEKAFALQQIERINKVASVAV